MDNYLEVNSNKNIFFTGDFYILRSELENYEIHSSYMRGDGSFHCLGAAGIKLLGIKAIHPLFITIGYEECVFHETFNNLPLEFNTFLKLAVGKDSISDEQLEAILIEGDKYEVIWTENDEIKPSSAEWADFVFSKIFGHTNISLFKDENNIDFKLSLVTPRIDLQDQEAIAIITEYFYHALKRSHREYIRLLNEYKNAVK